MLRLLSYLLGLLIFPSVQGGTLINMAMMSQMTNQLRELGETLEGQHTGLQESVSKIITKEDFANSIKALQYKLDVGLNRMEELRTMKIAADANDELKTQVTTLKDTIKDLQSQLKISEGQTKSKEDILKVKEAHLKNRDEQIADLRTQIKAIEKTKSELSSQLSELRKIDDKLKISEGQTKLKEDILKVKEEQIKSQQKDLTNKDKQISDLTTQIKAIEKTKSELYSQLSEYQIKLREMEPFKVSCESSPPGWTVIQRRIDGSENFNRTWNDYKSGFGNVSGEFFIGLEKLHRMTEARPHELFIKLGMVNGSTSYAHYDDFKIGSEEEVYELKNLGKYSGEAGDSLTYHKNKMFSSFDRDNDNWKEGNCASKFGAWWHNNCSFSSLNGKYLKEGKGYGGINWGSWHNDDWQISLTFTEIMIRPKSL